VHWLTNSAVKSVLKKEPSESVARAHWNWKYLCTKQLYAGQHQIKLINREGGQLGDRNIIFTKVRIMWLK